MGLGITRTYTNDGIPVWQNKPSLYQGGFKLVTTGLTLNELLPAGTPIYTDGATRLATPLKTAVCYEIAGGSAVSYKVKKGHFFAVGDYFAKTIGGAAYAITAIDTTTSALYDAITVGTTLGAASVGDVFFKSSATGASAAALDVTPNGLTYANEKIEANHSVGVVYSGLVYERRIPGIPSAVKTGIPLIVFSQSF